jgi:hypothetical protein
MMAVSKLALQLTRLLTSYKEVELGGTHVRRATDKSPNRIFAPVSLNTAPIVSSDAPPEFTPALGSTYVHQP